MKTIVLLIRPLGLALYQILVNSAFTLTIIVIGGVLLIQVPQSQDVLHEYMSQKTWTWQLTYLYGAVFFWSYSSQACLNLTLFNAKNINTSPITERIAKWIPFVISQTPFFVLWKTLKGYSGWGVLNVLIAIYLVYFFFNVRTLLRWDNKWVAQLWNQSNTISTDFKKLWTNVQFRIFIWLIGLGSSLSTILFVLFPVRYGVAVAIGAPAILVLGVSLITIFFSFLVFMGDPTRRPMITFFFLYIWVMSCHNDNKEVRQSKEQSQQSAVVQDFRQWVEGRKTNGYAADDTLDVILVATEGGGIRATAFTILSLLKLSDTIPDFDRHLYAVSGVSGGGVGATVYTAFRHDQQLNPTLMKDSLLRSFCHQDFLSDVLGGLLFSDALNSLSPLPIASLDRNKKLEDAWSAGYKRVFGLNTLDDNFTQLWKSTPDEPRNFDLPALLLNGTLAETGQCIITSNLDFKNKQECFKDIVFTFEQRSTDVPIKTAALLCARFPILTSGGLLKNNAGEEIGHVTDGGYFENTGLESLVQMLNLLSPEVKRIKAEMALNLKFHIVFLQNSQASDTEEETDLASIPKDKMKAYNNHPKPIKPSAFSSYTTIFKSFYNPWSRSTQTRNILFTSVFEQRKDLEATYHRLQLKRINAPKISKDRRDYPLGWFMSQQLINQMKEDLDKEKDYLEEYKAIRRCLGLP